MWQKCPICNGEGVINTLSPLNSSALQSVKTCTVCNGKKIISEINGLPPMDVVNIPYMSTDFSNEKNSNVVTTSGGEYKILKESNISEYKLPKFKVKGM